MIVLIPGNPAVAFHSPFRSCKNISNEDTKQTKQLTPRISNDPIVSKSFVSAITYDSLKKKKRYLIETNRKNCLLTIAWSTVWL